MRNKYLLILLLAWLLIPAGISGQEVAYGGHNPGKLSGRYGRYAVRASLSGQEKIDVEIFYKSESVWKSAGDFAVIVKLDEKKEVMFIRQLPDNSGNFISYLIYLGQDITPAIQFEGLPWVNNFWRKENLLYLQYYDYQSIEKGKKPIDGCYDLEFGTLQIMESQ